jgi:putative ABC transport system permease protein
MVVTRWFYTLPLRLRSLFRRRQVEQELDEELRYHLERQIEEYIARGLRPEEARYSALRALGGIEQRKEECRDMRRVNYLENLLHDLRYAVRVLRRSPGFTAVALLSLAFGIGANTAIFQLLNAVRLRSLPIANPHELVETVIAGGNRGLGVSDNANSEITNPVWEQIGRHQRAFSGVFAWGDANFTIGEGVEARQVNGVWVSGDYFPVLGINPVRGRLFTSTDDYRGCGLGGAVISYHYWQTHFGGEDSVIGKRLVVWDKPFQVIGVTQPNFFGLEVGRHFDLALPICTAATWGDSLDRKDYWWLRVMGRLRPEWTLAQASGHLNAISPGIFDTTVATGYGASYGETYRSFRLTATPASHGVSRLRRSYETPLWLLLGITGLVLMIACANLANLMLARASSREREMAVRVALGASRARLTRQMLSESILLAGSGAAIGASLAHWLSLGLVSFLSAETDPSQLDLSTDWRVMVFTASVAILTCLLFGFIPALRASRIEPGAVMRSGGRGLTADRERFSFQRILVIGQIAISLVLLVEALLFVRSFHNLITLDTGFRQNGILIAYASFDRLRLPPNQRVNFQAGLLEQVRMIPEVESAAISSHTPLDGSSWTQGVEVMNTMGEQKGNSQFVYASPGYFKTMETAFLSGRDFNDFDSSTSRKVAIVNEAFVRRFVADENPIGTTLRTMPEPGYPEAIYEIIGVVKDTKYARLRDDMPPIAYVPAAQHPSPKLVAKIAIRSSSLPANVMMEIKSKLAEVSPEIGVDFSILETEIRAGLTRERVMAWLAGFFGILAAALAMIGLYGVISYMVLRNEIGIRMALGASRVDIVSLILREMAALLLIGLGIGTAVSLAAAKSVGALLFGLSPHDPWTLLASICLLAAVAGLASFLPALRASRIDPMEALRHN